MSDVTRRQFLNTTTAAASALAASTYVSGLTSAAEARKKGDPVRIAVMGLNGRGRGLLNNFLSFPQVECTYLCDPDKNVLPAAVKQVTSKDKKEPKLVDDFRTILDDKNVDVLVCAAPDHWHALSTILACQAGKDVYVEKPASHNIIEGRRMIEAARKHKRVVQVGTQRRSGSDFISAVKAIREGKIGKVGLTRCWINSIRPSIGHAEVSEPPKHLDFNLWAGPATEPAYKKNLIPYHWHWRWNYGTGECGNNGIHALDIARWGMGVETPEYITCGGNKYIFEDDQETPDTQTATFDFKEGAITWEHRTWSRTGIDGSTFGIIFYGSKGTLSCLDNGWTITEGKDKVIETEKRGERERAHTENFLDCLVSREAPSADIEEGHRSTMLCHLANIAWRTRSTLHFDGAKEQFHNNPAANALLGREYRKGFELPKV